VTVVLTFCFWLCDLAYVLCSKRCMCCFLCFFCLFATLMRNSLYISILRVVKDAHDVTCIVFCLCSACPYKYQFRCGSGECIYDWYRCDGRINCRDGSDEICSLYSHEFRLLSYYLFSQNFAATAGIKIVTLMSFNATNYFCLIARIVAHFCINVIDYDFFSFSRALCTVPHQLRRRWPLLC